MKIGILTYHRACNYGAYLQACALCNRLNQEDFIQAEIIDFRMEIEARKYNISQSNLKLKLYSIMTGSYRFKKRLYDTFQRALQDTCMVKSEEYCESDSLEDFRNFVKGKYDVIIAGSDEIWKVNAIRSFPNPYWLIGNLDCKKVAYAASARVDFRQYLSDDNYRILKDAVNDFHYVGVRDRKTYDEVKKVLMDHTKLHLCCDPSFLYEFTLPETGIDEICKRKLDPNKKTILVMTEKKRDNIAGEILKQTKGRYNLVSVFNNHSGYINLSDVTPLEWLKLIKDVDLVVSSFFHATCFSIVLNTPFLACGTRGKSSKLSELLGNDELRCRYLEEADYSKADWNELIASQMIEVDFSEYVYACRNGFLPFVNMLRELDTNE